MTSVAAVILAAGRGERFAASGATGPKALAPFRGLPMIRCVASAALASRAKPVVAVLGFEAGQVRSALSGLEVATVTNQHYQQGLSASLRAGLEALPSHSDAAIILLADMPTVEPALINALIAAFEKTPSVLAVIPVRGGRRGNPALLSRRLFDAVSRLSGDQGAGRLLKDLRPEEIIEVESPRESIFEDADTLAELSALADASLTKRQPQSRK